jgi:hypothetical protein
LNQIEYDVDNLILKSLEPDKVIDTFEERTQKRLMYQQLKSQKNLEDITQKVVEQLKTETDITDEKLDEDWITRFFSYAEEISNDEMQNLWARILAGEIKKPKSFSLRTLQTLRNISKEEAQIFTKIGKYAIKAQKEAFVYKGNSGKILENIGINFNEIILLQELDLIHTGDFLSFTLRKTKTLNSTHFIIGNNIVIVEKQQETPDKAIPVYLFTSTGKELLNLIEINPEFEYIQEFRNALGEDHYSVKYGRIIKIHPDRIQHTIPLIELNKT